MFKLLTSQKHIPTPHLFNWMMFFLVCSKYMKSDLALSENKMEKCICQFHVSSEGTRTCSYVPFLSLKPGTAIPQPHQSPRSDHVGHGKAASLLALPNTGANSLCHFWEAVHGTKNVTALLSLLNPPMKFHFSDLFSLCGTKLYP